MEDLPWWALPLIFAILEGALCSTVGTVLLTQRRILQANLIAHGVLPGLAIAIALQLDPALGGWLSGLAAALLAERLIRSHSQQQEAVINTVLAGALATGVLLLALLEQRVELESLLFGDLLTAGWRDLIQTLVAAGVSLVFITTQYRPLVFSGVDPEGAESAGLRVSRLRTVLAVVTTLVVVSAIAAVGIILVIALLCAPAVLALQWATSLSGAMVRASVIGASCSLAGFGLALMLDLPPGPLIGWLCLLLLLLPKTGHRLN
jgi:zinc/manganese transport system permease protein|tara:strand:- start:1181 stop:1969 length:789 start_codon:yes stop_codon:yes gene_type:complete